MGGRKPDMLNVPIAVTINRMVGDLCVEACDALLSEVEALLASRIRSLRLSPALRAIYDRTTWPRRSRVIRSWLKWVAALCAAAVFADAIICPSIVGSAILVRVVILPAFYFGLLALWAKPRSSLIEGSTLVLAAMAIMMVAIALGAAAGATTNERYLAAGLFAASTAIATWPMPIAWTFTGGLAVVGLFLGAQLLDPLLDNKTTLTMATYYVAGFASFVSARHGKELIAQHSFLLGLRGELQAAALKRANAKLQVLAMVDGLTGLYNRRTIEHRLGEIVAAGRGVGIVLGDIDHFKAFNDLAGHLAGDECLRAVASALREAAGSSVAVGRYGGEEFLLAVEGDDEAHLADLCQRITACVDALGIVHPAYDARRFVTLSMGSARWPSGAGATTVVDLLAYADVALYRAKALGRNRACVANIDAAVVEPTIASAA